MDAKLFIAKIKRKLGNKNAMINYYCNKGLILGNNCNICSELPYNEVYLIEIGNNTVISYQVSFVTHDASLGALINQKYLDLYGKIKIGNNCFIGAKSTILYGVTLGDNTVVAAGAVVTKSFKEGNVVIGGNPAKVLCSTKEYIEKNKGMLIDTNGCNFEEKREIVLNSEKLIQK